MCFQRSTLLLDPLYGGRCRALSDLSPEKRLPLVRLENCSQAKQDRNTQMNSDLRVCAAGRRQLTCLLSSALSSCRRGSAWRGCACCCSSWERRLNATLLWADSSGRWRADVCVAIIDSLSSYTRKHWCEDVLRCCVFSSPGMFVSSWFRLWRNLCTAVRAHVASTHQISSCKLQALCVCV